MPDWYYVQGDAQQGPIDDAQLRGYLSAGWVGAGDLVWTDGMAEWQPAANVPGLMPAAPAYPAYPGYGPGQTLQYQSSRGYNRPGQYSGLATTSMVLGLCSFVIGGALAGIAALICGWIALNGMKRTGNYHNKGYAITGVVIGALWAVGMIVLVIVIIALVANQ